MHFLSRYVCHISCLSYHPRFSHHITILWRIQFMKLFILSVLPITSFLQIFFSAFCSQTPSSFVLHFGQETKFCTHTNTPLFYSIVGRNSCRAFLPYGFKADREVSVCGSNKGRKSFSVPNGLNTRYIIYEIVECKSNMHTWTSCWRQIS
jgi:hypothetical protein